MEKVLGKISNARFGFVFDRPFLFGLELTFSLDGGSSGIGTHYVVNVSDACKWSYPEERKERITEMVDKIGQILHDAQVDYVHQLKNIPVEVTIENNTFKDFRVLTEVL